MGASESALQRKDEEEDDKGVEAPTTKIVHPALRHKRVRELPGDVDKLRSDLLPMGILYLPSDEGYEEMRKKGTWNLEAMGRPSGIIIAGSVADVIVAVQFAAEIDIEFAIASARKSHLCVLDDSLVLDVSALKAVKVDQETKTATVDAGVTWRELDRVCTHHGLGVTGSYDPDASVIGMALHGGHGFLARKYGLLADNVLSAEVVLVSGEVVEAAPEHNSDLFWAIRGGGGNFGVVTKMRLALHELPNQGSLLFNAMRREPWSFGVWPFPSRLKMLDEYFQLCESAPVDLVANLDLAGAGAVTQVNVWVGEESEGEAFFEEAAHQFPFLSHPPALCNYHLNIQRQPAALWGEEEAGHAVVRRAFVQGGYPALARVLERAAAAAPDPRCRIRVLQLGGAAASPPLASSAVAHRQARHLVELRGRWDPAPDPDQADLPARVVSWVHQTYSEILPLATGALAQLPVPLDMADPAEERLRRRQTPYGSNIARLRAIKSQVDPTNVFRCNDNILGENLASSSLLNKSDLSKWQPKPDVPGPLPKHLRLT